jgi:hypothetical protein
LPMTVLKKTSAMFPRRMRRREALAPPAARAPFTRPASSQIVVFSTLGGLLAGRAASYDLSMRRSTATAGEWVQMRVLITVKAYPSISTKYGEAVCAAGVRLDTPTPEWVRLFPVRFRDLARDKRFTKYQVIALRAQKHSTDRRLESWRPDVESIQCGEIVPAGGPWLARRRYVQSLLGPTMCALHRGRKGGGDGASLGLIRPARVRAVRVTLESEWSAGQLGTVGQGSLLTSKAELVKPGHAFSYSYICEEPGCKGHVQKIVDWELGESYRSWASTGNELVDAIKRKWLEDMCAEGREPFFFVGDQHTRPGQFLVLGTFYPERVPSEDQLSLFLAA